MWEVSDMGFSLADALKGVSELDTGREQIEYIALDLIDGDENNFYKLSDLEGLADNISLCGLQQPIRLRKKDDGRFVIVSGHRRRAAIEKLAADDPEKWKEIPCIVEQDDASPALQQLRLIYANSNTRTMTSWEISQQAEQVKMLLYRLKEEEGYEFPGRMRDHVAEAVGISKSKLARLKVISDGLSDVWKPAWQDGGIVEETAYRLAQLDHSDQEFIFNYYEEEREKGRTCFVASDVTRFRDRTQNLADITCPRSTSPCTNTEGKRNAAIRTGIYEAYNCDKCCALCPRRTSCKYVCPKMADQIARDKAEAREARREEKKRVEEAERPSIEQIQSLWMRFGYLREKAGKSIRDVFDATKMFWNSSDDKRYKDLEAGWAKITVGQTLPYGYSFSLTDAKGLIAVADLFGCTLDELFCREEPKEHDSASDEIPFAVGAWYSASVEPPAGKQLILMDSGGYVDTGKYKGCGEYTMDFGDPVVLWTPIPEEKDVVTAAPVVSGWKSGTPDAYGTYVAYVRLDKAAKPIIRELLWDGEEWLLYGNAIHEDASVQCWTEQPDF